MITGKEPLQARISCSASTSRRAFKKWNFHIDVESLFHLPANVFIQSRDDHGIACNDKVSDMIGYRNRQEYEDATYLEMAEKMGGQNEQYRSFREDDIKVIKTGSPLLNVCEPVLYSSQREKNYYFISNRFPLMDPDGSVVAVLGICFEIPKEDAIKSNRYVANLINYFPGLNKRSQKSIINPKQLLSLLSRRESELMSELIRGLTIKDAAANLKISPRTAESYLLNIKQKLNCSSKYEAVKKVIDCLKN